MRMHATDGQVIERPIKVVSSHPGGFLAPDGVTPDGLHQGQTQLVDCLDSATACPVKIWGVPARITLYLTGAEEFTCAGCAANIHFLLDGKAQKTVSVQTNSTGTEIATVELNNVAGGGTYKLTITSTAEQPSSQVMQLRLGPPA
jgi:hypothetical protein